MSYMTISSRNNDKIKRVCSLQNSASARKKEGAFVLEGLRLCRDAALNNVEASEVYFTQKCLDKFCEDIELIIAHSKAAYLVTDDVFDKMSDTESTQGIITVIDICNVENITKIDAKGRYVACENVSNPSNLGAIARTAEALGVSGMLLFGNCCDRFNPKALRASMGAMLRLDINLFSDVNQGLKTLSELGLKTYASVVSNADCDVTDIDFTDGSVIFIGNEANGLSNEVIDNCDTSITISIKGKSESFNASVAAAILLWELMK